ADLAQRRQQQRKLADATGRDQQFTQGAAWPAAVGQGGVQCGNACGQRLVRVALLLLGQLSCAPDGRVVEDLLQAATCLGGRLMPRYGRARGPAPAGNGGELKG